MESRRRNGSGGVICYGAFNEVRWGLLLRPAVETAPEELKLAVHLRGQARPRRWTRLQAL